MKSPSDTQPSPLRRQAADVLHRARQLPIGHARNDLRQLAMSLLWLDERNREATLQDRVTAILADRLAQLGATACRTKRRYWTSCDRRVRGAASRCCSRSINAQAPVSSGAFIIALLARPAIESLHPSAWQRFRVFPDLEICADIRNAFERLSIIHPLDQTHILGYRQPF